MAIQPSLEDNYLPIETEGDFTEPSVTQTAAVTPQYFDIETSPAQTPDTPSTDPEVVKERSDKLEWSLGEKSPGKDVVSNQLANGDEPYLREALAASKALEDRRKRVDMVKEATQSIDRPLTVQEADEIMSLATADDRRDPKTILEELYGDKLAEGVPGMIKAATGQPSGPSVDETYMDQAGAVAKHAARSQIARTVLQDAEAQWKAAGIWDTGMSYAKQFIPFHSYSNLTGAVENAPTEFSLEFGKTIEEEIQYLYTLRPSRFREELTAAVRKISESSPLDAYLFAQGVLNYGANDQALDNLFGAMDMTSFLPFMKAGRTAGTVAKAADAAKVAAPVVAETTEQAAKASNLDSFKRLTEFVQAMKSKREVDANLTAGKAPDAPVQTIGQSTPQSPVTLEKGISFTFTGDQATLTFGDAAESNARTITIDTGKILEKAATTTPEVAGTLVEKGKASLYKFLKDELGFDRSLMNTKLKDRSFISNAAIALFKRAPYAKFQDEQIKAFLNDKFDVWPEYRQVTGKARTEAWWWGNAKTNTVERSLVTVNKEQIFGPKGEGRIRAGVPLYKDAGPLPKELADDPDAHLEMVLWHETAHTIIHRASNQTLEQYEDTINAAALLKLQQQRLKPGLRASAEFPMGNQPKPIPYQIKGSVKPNEPRELAVIFTEAPVAPKVPEVAGDLPVPDVPSTVVTTGNKALDPLMSSTLERFGHFHINETINDFRKDGGFLPYRAELKMLRDEEKFQVDIGGLDPTFVNMSDNAVIAYMHNDDKEYGSFGLLSQMIRTQMDLQKAPITEAQVEKLWNYIDQLARPKAVTPPKRKIEPYVKYDAKARTLTVNKPALERQWERKPWASPKTKGVKPIGTDVDFAEPQDWIQFTVAKQKLLTLLPKKHGQPYADHINYVNNLALQELRLSKTQNAIVEAGVLRDAARAASDPLSDASARMGIQADENKQVYERVIDELKGLDPTDDGMVLRKRTVSLFNVDQLGDAATAESRSRHDRILDNLRANAVRLLGIPLNNAAIVRIPEQAMMVAIEETKKSLKDTYDRVNDAFLDVSLGGPFSITRPEDQLVNSTVVHLKMGTPDGRLFDNPTQAATYGVDQYGLSPSQFTILQKGQGFYINIAKSVDETLDSVRNAIVQTNNQSTRGFLGAFLGWFKTSDDLLGQMANENRMLATTAAQEVHRLLIDSAQTIAKDLTKEQREQLRGIWERNRDFEEDKLDDAGRTVTKRGMFYQTLGEFEQAFFDRWQQLPTDKQTEAYFTYVQLYDIDYVLRNLALHRDMARMGAEKMRVFFDKFDPNANASVSTSTRAFAGRITDRLPLEDQSEDFGIWMYDPATKKGEYFLRSQVTPDVQKEFDRAINERGFKVVEVVNPLEKPLMEAAGTSDTINFMLVKNFENTKFDWGILPYQQGGHLEYGDQFFVKQPRIRRSTGSGSLRHIYEGDTSILNAATQAEAEKFSKAADTARLLLKAGRIDELRTYLYQNTPWDLDTFKSFFAEKDMGNGVFRPALLHLDDPITWTYTGRNSSDMDHFKGAFSGYENFHNGVRSKYNLFAQGVDKKYLGSRDPDLPRVEESGTENNPIYKLAKPRLLSPLDTLNKALANVSRSRHMNDYKTSAVESFIEEFHKVMKLPDGGVAELRRNPVYYFHNPPWDTETTNKTLLAAAQNAHKAHTYFIGAESELGSKMWWLQSKIVDQIYTKLGQKASNIVTEKYLPTVKDPFTYARSIAFHTKLGLFNPVQLFLQAQSFVHVASIAGPLVAGRAAMDGIRMRMLALTEDEKIIDQFARWSGDAKLFRESYKELKKTGYYNVGGEVAWRDDVFDPDIFQGPMGSFLEKGTFFFKEGERFVRLSAWNAAFYNWRQANPSAEITNAVRNQILKRADLMAVNMTRASNASWQQGLFSIPTQFLSFQARLAEQLLPGFSTRLTPQEKLRAFATYSTVYGVPIGVGAATAVYPFHEDIRQAALERGINLDNKVLQLFHEGLLDTMFSSITGKEYNINERLGPKGTSLFKEIVNGDVTMTEFLLGASGSIIGDMITSAEPATRALLSLFSTEVDPPTMEDFIEVTRNVSTINNGMKAWYMYNQGKYFTKGGSTVIENATGLDAFMTGALGVTPEAATDTFVMIKSRKEQREAEQAAEKEIVKWYRKAIREYNQGNDALGDAYNKRAKAWLISSGIRPSDYGKILNSAIKGNETLFNSVREDFWRKAPASQIEPRRQMIQESN